MQGGEIALYGIRERELGPPASFSPVTGVKKEAGGT